MPNVDLDKLIEDGCLIDNRRRQDEKTIAVRDILSSIAKDSEGFKCAVGYFYLQGLALIINELRNLKEIKILMGSQTTKLTKKELIKAFDRSFGDLEETKENVYAIVLFHRLIKESKTLQILAYFGENDKEERLHSKAYLFLRNVESSSMLDRYRAGIIGSSNLTPSGLMGNTELNVILTDPKDLRYLESWFDELWKLGSNEFEKLIVTDTISQSIEKSKFGKYLRETFIYLTPKEFFPILIKNLKADYLFEDWKESKLLAFQQIDAIRCLRLFREKNYRGVFLTSSVGLGKSYVACKVAKYFIQDSSRVLLVAPSGLVINEDQWPRYLKEFNLKGKIDIIKMGDLQKDPIRFEQIDLRNYEKEYSLIIVDEAHNYRNEDAYRTRNLKKVIDRNGDANVLFLTATPINTSLYDLLNLIKIFHRPGQNLHFDHLLRELSSIVKIISEKEYEKLTKKEKERFAEIQQEFESELFVKSTRETIKTSPDYLREIKIFTGMDISSIPDPQVDEIIYTLDEKYKEIINGLVDFINTLTAAHLRIIEPEKGARLGPFFKWILYKRFESDISSFYLTLKRILKKNQSIIKAIESHDENILESEEDEDVSEVEVTFTREYKEKLAEVIKKIKVGTGKEYLKVLDDLKKDAKLIERQIDKLQFFLQDREKILFIDDRKLSQLLEVLRKNNSKKLLIFSEYRDTLEAINQFLRNRFSTDEIQFIESNTKNKDSIIERFNNEDKLRILVSTDTLSEGYNISGADVVINFDIPYNPVRLIQRIGRATRLDHPKPITVLNFRPDESIDREIDLVERLKVRIEDIIRFVGLEYRIWFQREEELLKERRKIDVQLYREAAKKILQSYKEDMWKGRFDKLESVIPYSNPTLVMLLEAIQKYNITKEEVSKAKSSHNHYTLLKGNNGLAIYHDSKMFGEDSLRGISLEEYDKKIGFEEKFVNELRSFKNYLEKIKQQETVLFYYNDKIDRMVRSILDKIIVERYDQRYAYAKELKHNLLVAKEQCGDETGRIIQRLQKEIKTKPSNEFFRKYSEELKNSFTKRMRQEKLISEDRPYLAVGILDE